MVRQFRGSGSSLWNPFRSCKEGEQCAKPNANALRASSIACIKTPECVGPAEVVIKFDSYYSEGLKEVNEIERLQYCSVFKIVQIKPLDGTMFNQAVLDDSGVIFDRGWIMKNDAGDGDGVIKLFSLCTGDSVKYIKLSLLQANAGNVHEILGGKMGSHRVLQKKAKKTSWVSTGRKVFYNGATRAVWRSAVDRSVTAVQRREKSADGTVKVLFEKL